MSNSDRNDDWRMAHGFVIILGFALLTFLPESLRVWPLALAIPISFYFLVSLTFAPLRSTLCWLRPGRVDKLLVLATILIALLSCSTLAIYQATSHPDLAHLDAYLPLDLFGPALLTAVVFSLLNALLEEMVFRGILFQAFEARWNGMIAVLATSIAFGAGHVGGYPPGTLGGVLAGVYAIALGLLRLRSGGLFLPVLAHIAADATIAVIRLQAADG